MAALSDSAIIVIVIVACLAIISLFAALSPKLAPPGSGIAHVDPSESQQMYMRSVRQRTLDLFRRESVRIRDLESPCMLLLLSLLLSHSHGRTMDGD